MDIKEIAEQVSKRIYVEDGLLLSKFISEKFAESLISAYKAELLNEAGEPVLYAEFAEDGGWLGDASEYADHLEEPHALFTSDQIAAAILKATNPLEDQLAAAQEDNRKLRIALDSTKRDLIRMRCPDFFEGVRDGYEFSFDNHLVNMIGLINDYAKQK